MPDRRRTSLPRWILVAGFVLGSVASALAQGLPRGQPAQLGFAPERGGTLDGARILAPATVALMTADHVGNLYGSGASGFGLGFEVLLEPGRAAQYGTRGRFGWGGAYATNYWVDPGEDLVAVFMIQPMPAGGLDLADKFRTLVYQAIVGSGQAAPRRP